MKTLTENQKKVIDTMVANPEINTNSKISAITKINFKTVVDIMKKLIELNLIKKNKIGLFVTYQITQVNKIPAKVNKAAKTTPKNEKTVKKEVVKTTEKKKAEIKEDVDENSVKEILDLTCKKYVKIQKLHKLGIDKKEIAKLVNTSIGRVYLDIKREEIKK